MNYDLNSKNKNVAFVPVLLPDLALLSTCIALCKFYHIKLSRPTRYQRLATALQPWCGSGAKSRRWAPPTRDNRKSL